MYLDGATVTDVVNLGRPPLSPDPFPRERAGSGHETNISIRSNL